MIKLAFTKSGPKLSAGQLKALEEQLGCALPEDYRDFLGKHNGGIPDKRNFYQKGDPDTSWIDDFSLVDEHLAEPSKKAHVFSISFRHFKFEKIIHKDCLVIGIVNRDDPLLLRIRGTRRGQVAVKNTSELEFPADPNYGKNKEKGVHTVAESFSDFLEMLIPGED